MATGPRVLVVGAGHAGLAATHGVLARVPGAHVVLFEPRETHLLKPRILEALAEDFPVEIPLPPLIASPRIRHVRAAASAVDPDAVEVEADGERWGGDFLVIAAGARTHRPPGARRPSRAGRGAAQGAGRGAAKGAAKGSANAAATEGRRRGAPRAFRLDGLTDVLALRRHLRGCVERAADGASFAQQRALLSVLVVGGGYTGVESSAEIALFLRRLANAAGISPALVHVTLAEGRERLFAGGVPDDELSLRVDEGLARLAVDVRLGASIRFEEGVPILGRRPVDAATVILATGIEGVLPVPKPLAARTHRWRVDRTLRIGGRATSYAAGDIARVAEGPRDDPRVVASAQHAVQAGAHAARMIANEVKGRSAEPFTPATVGEFVLLGDGEAVGWIQFAGRRVHLSGLPAATARAAAYARYLARLRIGALRAG